MVSHADTRPLFHPVMLLQAAHGERLAARGADGVEGGGGAGDGGDADDTVLRRRLADGALVVERLATERADVLVTPEVGDIGVDELHRGPELVRAGEAAARAVLPRIRMLVERTVEPPAEPGLVREAA